MFIWKFVNRYLRHLILPYFGTMKCISLQGYCEYFKTIHLLKFTVWNAVYLVAIWETDLYMGEGFEKLYISLPWPNMIHKSLNWDQKGKERRQNLKEKNQHPPPTFLLVPYCQPWFEPNPQRAEDYHALEDPRHTVVEKVSRGQFRKLCGFALLWVRLKSPW